MEKQKCVYCDSANTKRAGKRKNKYQALQRYKCKSCNKTFTLNQIKSKTYAAKIILNAISSYNLGYTQEEASKLIAKQYKIKVPQKTISNWLEEYKAICTFYKLRKQAVKLFKPKNIIFQKILNHIQPYTFKYHKAKLYILFHNKLYNNQFHNISQSNASELVHERERAQTQAFSHATANSLTGLYEPIKQYLEKIPTSKFPHHIFTYYKSSPNAEIAQNNLINENINNNATSVTEKRASQIKFNHLNIEVKSKNNFACKLAKLALNLAATNKQRHESIQDFMLINDSTTIAVEVPVYLTNWDAGYYRNQNGFIFPLNSYKTPITGHIDILQIRNGLIHILDYKPDAKNQSPVEQLTIYALALSRKLNLPLYYFKTSWFDENNYYEFFPLHAVYEKK